MAGYVMGKLSLRHARYTRQSGKSEPTAIIGQKRSEVIGKLKMKAGHFFGKVGTERFDHSHKIIMRLLGCRTLTDRIEVKMVVIRHIGAIYTVLGPFYKYSYVFHISISLMEGGRGRPPSLFYFLFSSPADRRIDFSVPAATSCIPWLLVVNFSPVAGFNHNGCPARCSSNSIMPAFRRILWSSLYFIFSL